MAVRTVTIPAGGGASEAIPLKGSTILFVQTPAAWTGADISPELSFTPNGAFAPMFDDLGNQIVLKAGASRMIRCDERLFQRAQYVRFRSVNTSTPSTEVNQAAARALLVDVVPINSLMGE